mgnify:CR=1 FL=1
MWYKDIINIIRESFSFAIFSLLSQKLRTALSLIGVILGVFSVIVVLSLIDSMKQDLYKEVQSIGKDVLLVGKYPWDDEGGRRAWRKYQARPTVSIKEADQLKKSLFYAKGVSYLAGEENLQAKSENEVIEGVVLYGTSKEYPTTSVINIENGRYFSDIEDIHGGYVAIVSKEICNYLYPFQKPLGKDIIIKGQKFQIIGVLEESGESMFNNNGGKMVYIPIKTFGKYFQLKSDNYNPSIIISPKVGVTLDQLKEEAIGVLRNIRRLNPVEENNFAINSSDMIKEFLGDIFGKMNLVGIVIGIFALLVGMFGISNIMSVSVKERTAEIGIQKALGAKKSYILYQFLFESILLCLFGGILSLGLVFGLFAFINSEIDFGLTLVLGNNNIILGLIISVLVGVLSGIIPASRAANMHPVEAISSK